MTVVPAASQKEFIVLVALLTAMVAMSIDAMVPALGTIAGEFGVAEPNRRQYIVFTFFLGMMFGNMIYGPISDSTGRKPAIFAGLAIYLMGTLLCMFSLSFTMMLAGRLLQGLGAAGPRIVAIAMVRDGQAGAAMARIMSFVMSVFMLVPIVAPSLGQLVLMHGSWRLIFVGFFVMAFNWQHGERGGGVFPFSHCMGLHHRSGLHLRRVRELSRVFGAGFRRAL
jgi:MFS transporter, DHA1 family, multidrug resistance protein